MCDLKEIELSTHQGLGEKLNYNIWEKCHQTGKIHLFMLYSGWFPLQLRIGYGPYYDWVLSSTPCPRATNISSLCEKLCWFQIWSQSNFWLWTIIGCHKLLKGHHKKTVGSSDWVRESFIAKTNKLTAWFLHALEYCLCIDRWLSLQITGVFFSF